MTQPFEDFLVEVHNNAEKDNSVVLDRIRAHLHDHLAGRRRGVGGVATERQRLAIAFRNKGLTTELSQRILDMIEHG